MIDATGVPVLAVDPAEGNIDDLMDCVCWNSNERFETTADDVRNVRCPYRGSGALNSQSAE